MNVAQQPKTTTEICRDFTFAEVIVVENVDSCCGFVRTSHSFRDSN